MSEPDSPFARPVGVPLLVRGLIVLAGTVAVGEALMTGRLALGIAGAVFIVVAFTLSRRVSPGADPQ
jgi:hypothetical protein